MDLDSPEEDIRFVWIDLEMTGLNPDVDQILEIAVVVTGADLKPLGELTMVVHHAEETVQRMSKVVHRMHSANGLIEDVLVSKTTLREAERAALAVIVEHCLPGAAFLCGNNVHHDWRFLARHMPRVEQYLHYRQVDVATIKVLAETWAPAIVMKKEPSNHRALADIHDSIAELRYYCETLFRGSTTATLRRSQSA
ncbi:MAG TPA: oligoribonuclease [Polyangia bacterium]